MNARIRPSGAGRGHGLCREATQRFFHHSLHGPPRRLSLPADEAAAIEVKQRQKGPGHRAEI